jgi:hypothetical protein
MMSEVLPKLYAVIGVWLREGRTFYVQRSEKMTNYPLTWSLLSIQFQPDELEDPTDLDKAQGLMKKLSIERLGGVSISTKKYLASDNSSNNPIGKHVFLHMYEVDLLDPPLLNPDYYRDSAWLTPTEYEEYVGFNSVCGLCIRMWSDYAWMHGLSDRPFAPSARS